MSFDVNYPKTMWADTHAVETGTHDYWYSPILEGMAQRSAMYSRFATVKINMTDGNRARKMSFDQLISPKPNTNPLDNRALWTTPSYMDSLSHEIEYGTYGGKLALHEEDDLFRYWELNGGQRGLIPIITQGMGQMIVDQQDLVCRNTILQGSMTTYGTDTGTDFASIGTGEKMTNGLLNAIKLGLKEREMLTDNIHSASNIGSIFCVTTHGVLYDLQESLLAGTNRRILEASEYSTVAVQNEEFSYGGIRFIGTPMACLYNTGAITTRTTVTAPIIAGEGAPNPNTTKVRGTYRVGQPSRASIKYHIEVADTTGFAVGDRVTIHTATTPDFGIDAGGTASDGVDWRDNFTIEREIHSISGTVGGTITFTKPIMEDYATTVSSGVYAYVTKGRHIHTATFFSGNQGIVLAVAVPTLIKTPGPVDDFGLMQRFTFRGRWAYNEFKPEHYHVAFLSGSNVKNNAVIYTQ